LTFLFAQKVITLRAGTTNKSYYSFKKTEMFELRLTKPTK